MTKKTKTTPSLAALENPAYWSAVGYRVVDAMQAADSISPDTARAYRAAVESMAAQAVFGSVDSLTDLINAMPKSRRGHVATVTKHMLKEIEIEARESVTVATVDEFHVLMARIGAIRDRIKVKRPKGGLVGTRLDRAEVEVLKALLPDREKNRGKMDRVLLGLMLTAGLRRSEVVNLEWDQIVSVDGVAVLNIVGKGSKKRTVPIKGGLESILSEWGEVTGRIDPVCRSVSRHDHVGSKLSGEAVRQRVNHFGARICDVLNLKTARCVELTKLKPHDLRRTFASLAYKQTKDLESVSKILGHSSSAVTRIYIGLDTPTTTAFGDAVPFL